MRKIKLVLVSLIFTVMFFTGCIRNNNVTPPPDEVARLQSVDIIKCFENQDVDGLKNMFSKKVSGNCNLDEEIKKAFSVIDGKIISYDEPDGTSGGASFENGERIEQELQGKIENIKTDTQKMYEIGFASYSKYKSDNDLVGMVVISVRDSNNNSLAKIGGWDKTGIISP